MRFNFWNMMSWISPIAMFLFAIMSTLSETQEEKLAWICSTLTAFALAMLTNRKSGE